MLSDHHGLVQLETWPFAVLHMNNIGIARNQRTPVTPVRQGEHLGKRTARTRMHQIRDLVPHLSKRFTQPPDHALSAAIGEHRDHAAMDNQDLHGETEFASNRPASVRAHACLPDHIAPTVVLTLNETRRLPGSAAHRLSGLCAEPLDHLG